MHPYPFEEKPNNFDRLALIGVMLGLEFESEVELQGFGNWKVGDKIGSFPYSNLAPLIHNNGFSPLCTSFGWICEYIGSGFED